MALLRATPINVPLRQLNFVFIGQSNISGRGFLADLPANAFPNADRVKIFGNDWKWRAGAEPVDLSTNEIDTVSNDYITIEGGVGVGPCMAFANRLAGLLPNTDIGIVNAAAGATSSAQWARSESLDTLYGLALAKTRQVARKGQIAGLIIGQGQSDATTDYATANTWDVRMAAIIASFRADVGLPNLPVVVSIIEPLPAGVTGFPYWDTVRAAQIRLSGSNIIKVYEDGLAHRTDSPDQRPHFSTAGQLEYGVRLADAIVGAL